MPFGDWIDIKLKDAEAIYQLMIHACSHYTIIDNRIEGWCRKLAKECFASKAQEIRLEIK